MPLTLAPCSSRITEEGVFSGRSLQHTEKLISRQYLSDHQRKYTMVWTTFTKNNSVSLANNSCGLSLLQNKDRKVWSAITTSGGVFADFGQSLFLPEVGSGLSGFHRLVYEFWEWFGGGGRGWEGVRSFVTVVDDILNNWDAEPLEGEGTREGEKIEVKVQAGPTSGSTHPPSSFCCMASRRTDSTLLSSSSSSTSASTRTKMLSFLSNHFSSFGQVLWKNVILEY